MGSVLFLEQPGRWRLITTGALLFLVALPVVPLGYAAVAVPGADVGRAFWQSMATSARIAAVGACLGFAFGLPIGVGTSLAVFPGRRVVLAAISLPLVAPSFLWAIGWSAVLPFTTGVPGCILIAATTTTALVVFASYAATLELSRSQIDAVLLTGGEGAVLRHACRHAVLPAVFGAALGGVITLSDPGPGQILGAHTAAAEILTTFAVRYDIPLAAMQCLVLAAIVAAIALPLAWIAGPRLAEAVLARQLSLPPRRGRSTMSTAVASIASAYVLLIVAPPIVGLLVPLVHAGGPGLFGVPGLSDASIGGNHLDLVLLGALGTAARTALNTFIYAGGAAALAILLGVAISVAVGRDAALRTLAMSVCTILFSWPSFAGALGVARVAALAPAALDGLLRSRFTVCSVLALHLAPVAIALALRAVGAIAPSWTYAAAIHGVAVPRYVRLVLWPALRPSLSMSFALVALLASADAGTVLLLHPPGEASLPLAIFTVMANAPETAVASLCLVYLIGTVAVLAAIVGLSVERAS
jgi:ABC-type Fe3+ transport system permease subunit